MVSRARWSMQGNSNRDPKTSAAGSTLLRPGDRVCLPDAPHELGTVVRAWGGGSAGLSVDWDDTCIDGIDADGWCSEHGWRVVRVGAC